ncbi:hypothetical protein DUD43_07410 [Alcaligenes faecalis]|uniref:hypothetical protein n=1 Tax=Alcaligenes faecalis TaxID=511 RepID=UPI00129304D9|nr:hypothetical protein [Alcaligenes faecalis]QFY77527.1 hypothetical protein DUD43_07410 [Alcaligenes faecalis]
MSVSYSMPRFQAIDMFGRPMVGARLYIYQNKTTTPSQTWKDKSQATSNTNPIVLDARGEAVIWLASDRAYTFVLRDIFGVLVWSQDDVGSGSAGMVDFDQSAKYPPGSIGEKLQQSVSTGNQRGGFAVAGVIRRDASVSPDWTTISDASHKPINWVGPSGSGVDQRVEFKSGPVASFIVCPDETFAKDGVTAGISGGSGAALISMGAPCTFEADVESITISRYNARYFSAVRFTVSRNANTGLITLTHPATFSHQRPIVQYQPKNSTGELLIPHHVSSSGIGGGTTTLFLIGEAAGAVIYTGSQWVLAASAWESADVSFEYEESTGTLKVNHPRVLLSGGVSPRVQVSLGGAQTGAYFLTAFDTSETSFKVRFRNHNNAIPTLNANMGFYFSRGMTAPRKNPAGSIMVDIGRVHVAMNQVSAPSGNLWCLGINNLS